MREEASGGSSLQTLANKLKSPTSRPGPPLPGCDLGQRHPRRRHSRISRRLTASPGALVLVRGPKNTQHHLRLLAGDTRVTYGEYGSSQGGYMASLAMTPWPTERRLSQSRYASWVLCAGESPERSAFGQQSSQPLRRWRNSTGDGRQSHYVVHWWVKEGHDTICSSAGRRLGNIVTNPGAGVTG